MVGEYALSFGSLFRLLKLEIAPSQVFMLVRYAVGTESY
jgi:hypothetical protein